MKNITSLLIGSSCLVLILTFILISQLPSENQVGEHENVKEKDIVVHYMTSSTHMNWTKIECEEGCVIKPAYLPSSGVRSYFAIPNHGQAVVFDVKVATNPNLKDTWWSLAYKRKPPRQTWILDIDLPPISANFEHLTFKDFGFHYVMGYKENMDLQYHLTNHWQPYDIQVNPRFASERKKIPKKHRILWLLANCELNVEDPLSRLISPIIDYVTQMQKYYPVDILYKEPCEWHANQSQSQVLQDSREANDYKYFLAVEDAFCSHFITQRIDLDGIPIVFGADTSNYQDLIPDGKPIINIEDFKGGPQDLANFLKKLDQESKSEVQYSGYFEPPLSLKDRLCLSCQIVRSVPFELARKNKHQLDQMWHYRDCRDQDSLWKYMT